VQGLMKTVDANSPAVSATDIWISLVVFVLVYIALGAADAILMLRYARKGLGHEDDEPGAGASGANPIPALTY
jgi:cytochrome bd-type quinol oxidase subunit 1